MCVASLFHLGFLLCLSIMDLCISWACPLSAHRHGFVRPILQGPSSYIFILFSCPLNPMGPSSLRGRTNGVTIQSSWVDGSNACGLTVQSSWDDDSNACGLTVSVRMLSTVQTSNKLYGSHYGA